MSNSLEEDLEQLYIDGYKKGRADERERCIQIATKAQIKHQSINGVFSDSGSSIIRAIKAE